MQLSRPERNEGCQHCQHCQHCQGCQHCQTGVRVISGNLGSLGSLTCHELTIEPGRCAARVLAVPLLRKPWARGFQEPSSTDWRQRSAPLQRLMYWQTGDQFARLATRRDVRCSSATSFAGQDEIPAHRPEWRSALRVYTRGGRCSFHPGKCKRSVHGV
jgi:hypothetical protein